MEKNLEIKKLADIVVWADALITAGGYNDEKYKNDAASAYCHVKAHELWKIKTVVLEAIDRHAVYTNALNKDIADKAAKIDLLEKEIEGRKEGYTALKELMDTKYISIEEHNDICKTYEDKVAKLEKESEKWQDLAKMNRDTICDQYSVCERFKNKIAELERQNKYLTKELEETYRTKEADLKNHNKRDMTLVDELAKKNDEIKELKEENSYLKSEIKQKQGIISKAYERYSNEIIKTRKDVLEVAYRDIKKDNGYVGFKLYVKNTLAEAEGNKNEANKVITEEVRSAYAEWSKTQKEKEEETKVKGVSRTSSGRYPWGAKVNGIPCGEDSIE